MVNNTPPGHLWPTYVPGGPIPELLKIVAVRHALREQGFLPLAGIEEPVAALVDAFKNGWFVNPLRTLDKARCTAAFIEAWQLSVAPCAFLSPADWLCFFELAQNEIRDMGLGYPAGAGTVEIFRGCRREHLAGLSWTTDFHTAVWFAMRQRSRGLVGEVYRAVAPAEAVLADFGGEHSTEHELVVNPEKIGTVSRAALSLEDKESLLREWLVRSERRVAEMSARGVDVFVPPTIDTIAEPSGGWTQFPQSLDPDRPGYLELSKTPDSIIWPSPGECAFSASGAGVKVEACFEVYIAPEGADR